MALRAVADHPKLFRLKTILKCGRGEAMGYLEATWHFTGKFAPQGNLGKYSDADIESWIEWRGEPGALIAALVTSGWVDAHVEHRLLVHDWHDHADDATRLALKRKKIEFLTRQCPDSVPTVSGLPEPEPEPAPEPVPVCVPDAEVPPPEEKADTHTPGVIPISKKPRSSAIELDPEIGEIFNRMYANHPKASFYIQAVTAFLSAIDGTVKPISSAKAIEASHTEYVRYWDVAQSRGERVFVPHLDQFLRDRFYLQKPRDGPTNGRKKTAFDAQIDEAMKLAREEDQRASKS